MTKGAQESSFLRLKNRVSRDIINSLINKNLMEIQYEAEEHSDCG